jgi:dihydropteroate synthase
MKLSLEEALIEVWRQALVENAKAVKVGGESYPVRRTPKRGLRQVDFVFDGNEIRGLEQNPDTKSRWAQMARAGKKVMQFLSEGRYMANVVDGKVNFYGRRRGTSRWANQSSSSRRGASVVQEHDVGFGVRAHHAQGLAIW